MSYPRRVGTTSAEPGVGGAESRLDRKLEHLGAWSGIAFVALAGAGYAIAGFIPVRSPSLTPEQLSTFVSDHKTRILVGMALLLIGGYTFLFTWSLTLAHQVREYANPSRLTFYVQFAIGLNGAIIAMFCGVIGTAMAFRAQTLAAPTIQVMYDILWFLFLIPWPPFMLWQYLVGFAILSSTNDERFFPRWIGYFSLWAGALELFSLFSPFWYRGPFGYNGAMSFWVPGVSFFVWVLVFAVVQVKNWPRTINLSAASAAVASSSAPPGGRTQSNSAPPVAVKVAQ